MIPTSGDIKNMTVARLFQDFRVEKKSGTLVLSRDKETKKFHFRNGEIIYAASNLDEDQLGPALVSSGVITQEQHATAADAARSTGKPLGAMLVERGYLAPKDLVEGAKQQVAKIIASVLPWLDGKFSVDNQSLPLGEVIPLQLSTSSLLLSGMDKLDWKVVRKSLPPLKTVVAPSKDGSAYQQGIELDSGQRTVLAFINGSRTIEEICALSEMGDFTTLKALYALFALRLVDVSSAKAAEQAQTGAAASAAQTDSDDIVVTKDMILHALDSLDLQDYYEMLDIGRSATPLEIKKAYFRYAKRYHPDRHTDSEVSELKEQLGTLFMHITEAYNILSKEETRDTYNLGLGRGIKRYRRTEDVAPTKQDTQKTTAITQFNEGLKQFKAQNFWGAEEAFSWASRLDPANADYVFHHGLALARIPRRRHDAEALFRKALQIAPSKIDFYLELGNFYAKNGLKAKALATFNDALRREPGSIKVQQAIQSMGGEAKP
jgi:curved DNA-binding protein CbpA